MKWNFKWSPLDDVRDTTWNVNKVKGNVDKTEKIHENNFCLIETHGIDIKLLFKESFVAEKPEKQIFL